jgi:hypothetical protein
MGATPTCCCFRDDLNTGFSAARSAASHRGGRSGFSLISAALTMPLDATSARFALLTFSLKIFFKAD